MPCTLSGCVDARREHTSNGQGSRSPSLPLFQYDSYAYQCLARALDGRLLANAHSQFSLNGSGICQSYYHFAVTLVALALVLNRGVRE